MHLESGCGAKAVYLCLQVPILRRLSVAWFGFRSNYAIFNNAVQSVVKAGMRLTGAADGVCICMQAAVSFGQAFTGANEEERV